MGVPAGFAAQHGHGHVAEEFPVGVEVAGGRVEEVEAGQVGLVLAMGEQIGVEGPGERIGGENVRAAVAHDCGPRGDGVESPLQAAVRCALAAGGPAPGPGEGVGAVGGLGQMQEMGALGVVQLQRAGDGLEDGGGGTGQVAPFEFRVVLDAHVGQCGDLTPAQSGHAPSRFGRQVDLLRGYLRSPRGEELADLLTVVHVFDRTA